MTNNNIKILVIDDQQDNLITLNALIKDAFPEAIALNALNGKIGLELAAKEDPNVILLDIIMPGMDGYEVCQKLKADNKLCDIPVVFVTATANTKEALVKALESGAEAFLTKPIDEIELTAQIRAMLKIKEANETKKTEKFRLEKLVEERNKKLVQELEARKQAEEKLKKSEAVVRNKLKAITEPEGNIDSLELSDIINTEILKSIMEDFYQLTGMLGAVLDISGKVLVSVGWQDICTKFHRCHPETLRNCLESDTILSKGVAEGEFKSYHCKNNLWDIVTPIMIGGKHLGNVFMGQYFLEGEEPDIELFRKQAKKFGFDEVAYLAALDRVPHFDKKTVEIGMRFYSKLARLISTLSFSTLQQSRLLAERKQSEEKLTQQNKELIIAKEHAEESDRLKSAFLANMSHEIRTPMNGIMGFASFLQNPDLTGDTREQYIDIIKKSGERMLDTVNDLINISKIETGQEELLFKQGNPFNLIEEIIAFFKPLAENKGLELTFDLCSTNKHELIQIDVTKFNSIIRNLIKNAIKYTEKGRIVVTSYKDDENLTFSVKDTGYGIAQDRQDVIFDRFVQADLSDKLALEGSGLGLSIVKAYVEMMNGTIYLESELGKGSCFTVELPIIIDKEEVDDVKKNHSIKTPELNKILIAEDDEISFEHLSIILSKHVVTLLHARNGEEAVELARDNPDIEIILMDIKMPVMNGYEATKAIREFNKDVLIIAQTAYALSGDETRVIDAGCNDYITKPIDINKLLEKISG